MTKYFSMDGYVCGKINTSSTASGKQITEFTVNSPTRVKEGDEWKNKPQYFRCKYWHRGDRDFRAAWIDDGAHVQISGEPCYEEWEKNGERRTITKFNVDTLLLIAPNDRKAPKAYDDYEDSDIPF